MRSLVRVVCGVAVVGVALFGATATAVADDVPPPPNCTSADLAGVMAGVAAGTSVYLYTHPDVNGFFTTLNGLSRDEMRTQVQGYLDANPRVRDELTAIRQPTRDFRARCGGEDLSA